MSDQCNESVLASSFKVEFLFLDNIKKVLVLTGMPCLNSYMKPCVQLAIARYQGTYIDETAAHEGIFTSLAIFAKDDYFRYFFVLFSAKLVTNFFFKNYVLIFDIFLTIFEFSNTFCL